jgi:hypothetical protein
MERAPPGTQAPTLRKRDAKKQEKETTEKNNAKAAADRHFGKIYGPRRCGWCAREIE